VDLVQIVPVFKNPTLFRRNNELDTFFSGFGEIAFLLKTFFFSPPLVKNSETPISKCLLEMSGAWGLKNPKHCEISANRLRGKRS